MGSTEAEPILSRLDRLDFMLGQLEGMRGGGNTVSPRSSYASSSAPSSGKLTTTTTTATTNSSSSPSSTYDKSLDKHCRPIDAVVMETELKGSLVVRLSVLEDRLLKLCVQLEEERQEAKKKEKKEHRKVGLRKFVKSCVGGGRHKANNP